MQPELCEPCEITTYGDLPGRVFLCCQCGLTATEEPPPRPVCFLKGGRQTSEH